MPKVRVKVQKQFATRELRRFDSTLVEKKPILRAGEEVYLEQSAVDFIRMYFGRDMIAVVTASPEGSQRTVKTETPESVKEEEEEPPQDEQDVDGGEDEEEDNDTSNSRVRPSKGRSKK